MPRTKVYGSHLSFEGTVRLLTWILGGNQVGYHIIEQFMESGVSYNGPEVNGKEGRWTLRIDRRPIVSCKLQRSALQPASMFLFLYPINGTKSRCYLALYSLLEGPFASLPLAGSANKNDEGRWSSSNRATGYWVDTSVRASKIKDSLSNLVCGCISVLRPLFWFPERRAIEHLFENGISAIIKNSL